MWILSNVMTKVHTYDLFLHSDSGLCGQFSGVISAMFLGTTHLIAVYHYLYKSPSLKAFELYITTL